VYLYTHAVIYEDISPVSSTHMPYQLHMQTSNK